MKASLTLEDTSSDTRLTAHVIQISKIYETASLGNDPTLQNSRVVSCILALDTSPTSQQDKQNQQQNTNPPLLIGQNLLVKFYD
jgi:hypothetical protein